MSKAWSKEELTYLEEKWGTCSIPRLSKRLNRSIEAVRLKAYQLKLGNHRYAREEIPLNQFFSAIGYSYAPTNLERFKRIGVPIIERKTINKKFYFINLKNFWIWLEFNKEKLNFARFEKGALGAEPPWVNEKRKADQLNPAKVNVNKKWTQKEELLLIQKIKSGKYTYFELSKEFNRTEAAIKTRLKHLKMKLRPVQQEPVAWSKNDEEKLLELFKKGFDRKSIAVFLERSQLAIEWKLNKINSRG